MRLSEAAGLHVDDTNVRDEIPFINLKANPWRPLKTKSSERQIPLVGASFWAAKRIIAHQTNYAFPKYIRNKQLNSNSASAAINKWLKPECLLGALCIHLDTVSEIGFAALSARQILLTHLVVGQQKMLAKKMALATT